MKKFFVLMLLAAEFINAQSLDSLEKKFELLNDRFDKESLIVDSLNSVFSKQAEQIDSEKKKNNPDKTLITDLMAASVTVSNKLAECSNKVKQLEKDLDKAKEQLHNSYIAKIDSLERLKKTGKEDKDKLNDEIVLFTEKKLLVAPRILSLSFNPNKIIGIDLTRIRDPKEKTLYKEYLDNALDEVYSLLDNVGRQSSEADQIAALQTKTKRFLEEAEMESKVLLQRHEDNNVPPPPEPTSEFSNNPGNVNSRDLANQVQTYQLILRQLDIEQLSKSNIDWETSIDEMNNNFSLKDYQKLLNEVKKRLQEFKLVLANKIGSFR